MIESKRAYLSHSKLMRFVQDPWSFIVRYVLKIKEPEKRIYEEGKQLHKMINIILFAESLEEIKHHICFEELNLRTNKGKDRKKFLEGEGKVVAKEEQLDMVKCWFALARTDPVLADFPATSEKWVEKELVDSEKCVIGIPDLVLPKDKIIVDYKTTGKNATYDTFTKFNEISLLYQANIYLDLVAHNTNHKRSELKFYYLIASKTYPYHFALLPNQTTNALKEFYIDLSNSKPSLETDLAKYFEFYGKICDVLGYDPILEEKNITVASLKKIFKLLKNDAFFKRVLNYDKTLEFNDYALQRIFDRA